MRGYRHFTKCGHILDGSLKNLSMPQCHDVPRGFKGLKFRSPRFQESYIKLYVRFADFAVLTHVFCFVSNMCFALTCVLLSNTCFALTCVLFCVENMFCFNMCYICVEPVFCFPYCHSVLVQLYQTLEYDTKSFI